MSQRIEAIIASGEVADLAIPDRCKGCLNALMMAQQFGIKVLDKEMTKEAAALKLGTDIEANCKLGLQTESNGCFSDTQICSYPEINNIIDS